MTAAGAMVSALAVLAACGSGTAASPGAPATATAGATCGAARTAASVPVVIKVAKGTVDCAAALAVERRYAAAIRSGAVAGNGGGAPVRVSGWTCQGFPATDAVRTGQASECHTASAEVVAVLAVPSSGSLGSPLESSS